MSTVKLHDDSTIDVEVCGDGPTLLLPVNPRPVEGPQAEVMRQWGNDPALGQALIEGLRDAFRVVAFDYEGHVLAIPKPDTLTPENIANDFLAIADSVGAERFAYYGYSWLAVSGLQLALRTDRLSALVMGGFPPIDGPYTEMLAVTTATHELSTAQGEPATQGTATQTAPEEFDWSSVDITMSETQTRQFVTLYRALRGFDDRAAQGRITCPRLCFVGSADAIDYGERWGNVRVNIAGPFVNQRVELERHGWDVRMMDGLDHTQAMQAANVLPVLRPWLASALGLRPADPPDALADQIVSSRRRWRARNEYEHTAI